MDLKNPRWMYAKAVMFIIIGTVSFALVMLESPSLRTAASLLLMIWAFCRAYYFAFYVIEKYIDSEYRFAGLVAFFRYLLSRSKDGSSGQPQPRQNTMSQRSSLGRP